MDKRMILRIVFFAIAAILTSLSSCAFLNAGPHPQKGAHSDENSPWPQPVYESEEHPVHTPISSFEIDSVAADFARRFRWKDSAHHLGKKASLSSLDRYLLGYSELMLRHYSKALVNLAPLTEDSSSAIHEYVLFDYADALAGLDSTKRAIVVFSGIKDPALEEQALSRIYSINKKHGYLAAAGKSLDDLVKKYPKHFSQSKISLERAELALSAKDTAAAVGHYSSVIGDGTGSNVVKAASALERLGKLSGKNLFLAGKSAVNSKNYASGEEWIGKYIASGGKENLGEAHYLRARAISRRGRYSEAVTAYKKIVKEKLYNSAWAELGIGYCYRKLERFADAKTHIDLAISQGVGSNAEAEALWEGVELAEDMDDYKLAAEYAAKLAKKYPNHDLGDNGAIWAGLSNFLLGDFTTAEARFAEIPRRYSDRSFVDTGKFWSGLSKIAAGDKAGYETLREVSQSPERSYYRFYSIEVLTQVPLPNPAKSRSQRWMSFSEAIDKAGESLSELGHREYILTIEGKSAERAEIFAAMGLVERARIEFSNWSNELEQKPPVKLSLMAVAEQWGLTEAAYDLGLALVRDTGGYSSAPKNIIRLAFPAFFQEIIFATAERESIDAALLYAVMRRESRFDPHVVSYAGAVGLFQIMPQTGENLANRLHESKDFTSDDLYDFRTSIRYGARYLADLLRENELPEYALAEYNAGPTPLKRWKKTPHERYRSAFVEGIDFQQTRHYVKAVLGDYYAYKELWDGAFSIEDE